MEFGPGGGLYPFRRSNAKSAGCLCRDILPGSDERFERLLRHRQRGRFLRYDPPVSVIQVAGASTCANTTVLLTSQGSSSGSGITYEWSLNGTPVVTGLANWTATAPGEYCLTLTDEIRAVSARPAILFFQYQTLRQRMPVRMPV